MANDPTDAGDEPPHRRGWRTVVLDHGVVSAFTLLVSWPFLRPGRFVGGFDNIAYTGPNLHLTLEAWKHGHLALWNEQIFGGVTHVGNAQAGALYPLNALALPFGVSRGLAVLVVAHLLILANGMVALVGWRLRLRVPAAIVAGATIVGSGLAMEKALQVNQLLVLAWVPLLLALVHWTVAARRPLLPAATTAVVTALLLTAGHPQMVYTVTPFVVVLAVVFAVSAKSWRRLGLVAAAGVVGALLAAPQLLTTIYTTSAGALTGPRSLDEVGNPAYHLAPADTLRALLGNVRTALPDVDAGTYEALSFVGAAAATLALVGLVDGIRRRGTRLLAIVLAAFGVAGVVAAYGTRTALFRFAFDHVPLFDQARVPARWLTVTVLAAVLLAALGTDAVVGRRLDRRTLAVVGAGAILVAVLVAAGAFTTPGAPTIVLWLAAGGVALLGGALVGSRKPVVVALAVALPAVVVLVELGLDSRHSVASRGTSDRSIESYSGAVVTFLDGQPGRSVALTFDQLDDTAYLVASLRPNTNALFDVPSLDGYDGGDQVTTRWATAMGVLTEGPFDPVYTLRSQIALPVDAGALARYGVRWMLVDTRGVSPEQAVPGWRGPLASDDTVQLFENPAWQGEAVAWFNTTPATSAEDAARILESGAAPPNSAVVEDGGPTLTCDGPCPSVGLAVERSRPERGRR